MSSSSAGIMSIVVGIDAGDYEPSVLVLGINQMKILC